MKTGKTLSALAAEIERRAAARKDYVVSTNALRMGVADEELCLRFSNEELPITDLAHRQIGEHVGVPAKYYDRMRTEAPELLTDNVNYWLRGDDNTRMVRTLDGRVRAFLSNRYQRIDNHSVAEVVLPVLLEGERKLEIVSADITETRLYIKALDKSIVAEVKGSRRVGDFVEAGIMVTNSEVGLGAVAVHPFMNFLACLNGCVMNRAGMRTTHIGTQLDVDDQIAVLLADDTKQVLDQGVLLKVRDTVLALLNPQHHQERVDRMSHQTTERMSNPVRTIELLANDFRLSEEERSGILARLIDGADSSRYGLMNAVTGIAENAATYDRATELEIMGGRIFEMHRHEWHQLAEAA